MTALVINTDYVATQASSSADYDEQTFHPLTEYPLLQYMQTADVKRRLLQFDIGRSANIQVFAYSHPFDSASLPATTAVVTKLLQSVNSTSSSSTAAAIRLTPLRTTVSSVNFFDRLRNGSVVTESGAIRQCFETSYNNILINDELRKCILTDESDDYTLYNHNDRLELIFFLLQHVVVGGSLCQPSEMLDDYVDLVKSLYKTLIRPLPVVSKDTRTSSSTDVRIVNRVYNVSAAVGSKSAYPFETSHPFNLCLVSIDAEEQTMAVYTFNYKTHW